MKTREVAIFTGARFTVPQCIQRIDHQSTHGWQLRYGGTQLFSDHSSDGSGAQAARAAVTKALLARIAKMPAPSKLQRVPSGNKASDLREKAEAIYQRAATKARREEAKALEVTLGRPKSDE